jgi:hypothetical protein
MRGRDRRATYHRNSTHSLEVICGLPRCVSDTFAQTIPESSSNPLASYWEFLKDELQTHSPIWTI